MMRLISCYIFGFGTLNNKEIIFNNNLTSTLLENGKGKTTISNFIRAMLYGMPTVKANEDKSTSIRAHFSPLFVDSFGGKLAFECDGKEYTIVRTFDKKSKSNDSIEVVDSSNNKVTEVNGIKYKTSANGSEPSIGEVILGIDEETFCRCNYISVNDLKFEKTASMKDKIGDIVLNAGDDSKEDIDKNIAIDLKENFNKKGRNIGFGTSLKDKKKACEDFIEDYKSKLSAIYDCECAREKEYKDLEKVNEELESLKKKQKKLIDSKELKGKWDTFYRYDEDIKAKEKSLENIKLKYPAGIISKEDLNKLNNYKNEYLVKKQALTINSLTINEQNAINEFKTNYDALNVDDNYLKELSRKVTEYDFARDNLETCKSNYDDEEYKKFYSIFSKGDIRDISNDYNQIQLLENERKTLLSIKQSTLVSSIKPTKEDYRKAEIKANEIQESDKKIKEYDSFINSKPSIATILLFIFTLGIYYFVWKNKKTSAKHDRDLLNSTMSNNIEMLNSIFEQFDIVGRTVEAKLDALYSKVNSEPKVSEDDEKLQVLNDKIENSVKQIEGYLDLFVKGGDYNEKYDKYVSSYDQYIKLSEYKSKHDKDVSVQQNKLDAIEKTIIEKIAKSFDNKDGYVQFYEKLNDSYKKYCELTKKMAAYNTCAKDMEEIVSDVKKVFSPYGLIMDEDFEKQLSSISDDVYQYNSLMNEIKSLEASKEKYRKDNDLTKDECIDVDSDLLKINKDIEDNNIQKNIIGNSIASFDETIALKDEHLEKIEQNKAEIIKLEHEIFVAEKTKELIDEAQKVLEDRYIGPIKECFVKYAKMILNKMGEDVILTSDYELKYQRDGRALMSYQLSDGEKTIAMIALRFAIIDHLYKDGKTFIIMDDVFEHLSDANLKKAVEFVKEISKDKQIIYFTCHENANIK